MYIYVLDIPGSTPNVLIYCKREITPRQVRLDRLNASNKSIYTWQITLILNILEPKAPATHAA